MDSGHKCLMISRPDPLPFTERVWLRQTSVNVCRRTATNNITREDGSVFRRMTTIDCMQLVSDANKRVYARN